jgi:signal peptidase II
MKKVESRGSLWWNVNFVLAAVIIPIADQISKNWIRAYTGEQPIFQAGIFRIIVVENTGSSFGMFQDQNFILTIVAILGIILILGIAALVTIRYPVLDTWLSKLSLGLILGGTIGNLIDRFARGYVTDFLDIGPWPTFNVADSSMVTGVILLAGFILFSKRVKETFSPEKGH